MQKNYRLYSHRNDSVRAEKHIFSGFNPSLNPFHFFILGEFKCEIGLPEGVDVKRTRDALEPDGTLTIEIAIHDYVKHHQQAVDKCANSTRNRLERVDNSPWDSCI